MKAFLLCFILTPLFTYLAQMQFKNGDKKAKGLGIIFSIFAILIPSIIAGVRNLDVGRDIGIYVTPVLESALENNFFDYMANIENEIGYSFFIYMISLFTDNIHVVLFLIQLFTITFIYLFAYQKREQLSMWLVILIYLLSWYCISYTMMRQSMAVAILIFSTVFFENKKYLKTILLFLLAISFHVTAVLGLIVYLVMYIFSERHSKKMKRIMFFIFLFFIVLITIFYKEFLYFLTNVIRILPEKYYTYVELYTNGKEYTNYSEMLYKLFWIVSAIIYKFKMRKVESKSDVILIFLLIDFATFIMSFDIVNVGRAGYYFFYLAIFYLTTGLIKLFRKDRINQLIIHTTIITVLFVFWYWKFPVTSYCDTYPYVSDILTFLN